MLALVEADLFTDISKVEWDGLTKNLLAAGQADPATFCITKAKSIIEIYANPLKIPDNTLKTVWVLLAIWAGYNRLATVPKKRDDEWKWCIRLLEQMRDGRFPNLAVDETLVPEGQSAWGSNTRLGTNYFSGPNVS